MWGALLWSLLLPIQALASDFPCNYAGSQREMNTCAIEDYRQAFKDYALTYQRAFKGLAPKEQAALRAKSTAWAKVVRIQCLRASRDTGSDETILFYSCLQQVVEHRTFLLRAGHTQV